MSPAKSIVVISTGNILLSKKAGQKPVDELIDCLKTTFVEPVVSEQPQNGLESKVEILERANSELQVVEDGERSNVKIGAKIFLNNHSTENLKLALNQLYRALNVEHLDNLILAYHPKDTTSSVNGSLDNGNGPIKLNDTPTAEQSSDTVEWGTGHTMAQSDLIDLWRVLEEYAANKKIHQLGVADLDVNTLKELYAVATVRPTIAQINLQACCVVPPPLQEFCNQNEIQLLTHSDPKEILNESILTEVAGADNKLQPAWTIRYQVHLKCRGVLTVKGYLVGTTQ